MDEPHDAEQDVDREVGSRFVWVEDEVTITSTARSIQKRKGRVDAEVVAAVVPLLSHERRVFHSEADFQFALGMAVREETGARVRLEVAVKPGVHLDMMVTDSQTGAQTAVELKYLKAAWRGTVDDEQYQLPGHDARDLGGYDCLKDLRRNEDFVAVEQGRSALLVVLTNDPGYWSPPKNGGTTNAEDFRIHEGAVIEGVREWGPGAGPGTKSGGRAAPIELRGTYQPRWHDYSRLDGPRGLFRYTTLITRT
ncbi:hypothetical protein [Georgenia sp. Z1491]|uniref:hypothetical protein n=1 Tax=Georgenia sp. Z1491 TaxID=3416707 RepID=UPI003CE707CA